MVFIKTDNKSTGHSFEAFFKRATSPMVVLALLNEKPMYVYEISQTLKERSGNQYTIAVLYPVLYRLEEQGYVAVVNTEIKANRVRNYYGITGEGKQHLAQTVSSFENMVSVVAGLLGSQQTAQPSHKEEE